MNSNGDYSQQYCIINFKIVNRPDLNCFHHKKEVIMWCDRGVIPNAKIVIILQYINISKQHVVYLKLPECYMSIISQLLKKEIFWNIYSFE